MKSELCFLINGQELFTEQILVAFDVPLFFVCKDKEGKRYIVLCIDSEIPEYIVASAEESRIIDMLQNQLSMRDLLLSNKTVWRVTAKTSVADDLVAIISAASLTDSELPEEGACLELSNDSISDYTALLNDEIAQPQYITCCFSEDLNIVASSYSTTTIFHQTVAHPKMSQLYCAAKSQHSNICTAVI